MGVVWRVAGGCSLNFLSLLTGMAVIASDELTKTSVDDKAACTCTPRLNTAGLLQLVLLLVLLLFLISCPC